MEKVIEEMLQSGQAFVRGFYVLRTKPERMTGVSASGKPYDMIKVKHCVSVGTPEDSKVIEFSENIDAAGFKKDAEIKLPPAAKPGQMVFASYEVRGRSYKGNVELVNVLDKMLAV